MAAAFTSYEVENDQEFRAALKRAGEKVSDLRIPFRIILKDFHKSEEAIFELESAGQYPDFKTEESRDLKIAAVGFDYPLLERTGRLRDSVTKPNAPGSIAEVRKDELIIGTALEYGIFHQSDAPRKKIPLRKFLFIGPEAQRFAVGRTKGRLERWLGILNDYVLEVTNEG